MFAGVVCRLFPAVSGSDTLCSNCGCDRMKVRFTPLRFLFLTTLAGVVSLIWLLLIPGESGDGVVLGFSYLRLLYLTGLLLALALTGGITLRALRSPSWFQVVAGKVGEIMRRGQVAVFGFLAAVFVFGAGVYLLVVAFNTTDRQIAGVLTRLAPALFWLTVIGGQTGLYLFLHRDRFLRHKVKFTREGGVYFALVFSISLVVFQIASFRVVHWDELPEAAYGVIIGRPHWRAYSNRLLGPYAVYLISLLGVEFDQALEIFNFALIWLQNLVLFNLVSRREKSRGIGFRYVVFFSLLLIFLQDYFIYTWDYIDAVVFTLFAWGIFQSRPARFFVLLFLVELLNRETAVLISFYLMLDAFDFNRSEHSLLPRITFDAGKKGQVALGAGLTLAGVIYTKLVRDLLFIESSLERVGIDLEHRLLGNHNHFLDNMRDLFIDNFKSLEVVNTLFFLGLILYLLLLIPKFSSRHYKAASIAALLLISILIFGRVNEVRVLIGLIPFVLFFHLDLSKMYFHRT